MNLEGEIREINLIERLVELWRETFTGAIRFENDGVIKIVYFKGGDVLSASTNDRADSVDEILMRAGKVTREHVKQALARRKENETLGDALLNLGFITRKELTWARRVQVINVLRSIDQWGAGSFTIVADYLPKREEGTIFPLAQVLVELVVTDQDRQKYERELAGGSAVFGKAPDFDEAFARLGLNEDAEKITALIDGQRTASDIAAASGQEGFNTFKLLHALAVLGLLRRAGVAAPPREDADDFAMAGAADAADAWSVATPQFDLDDAPPVEVPPVNPATVPTPSFDDQLHFDSQPQFDAPLAPAAQAPLTPPAAEGRMPAWEASPRAASPAAAPAPEPRADATEEPQWGFDEALIETAKKAAVPPPARTVPPAASPAPARRATVSTPMLRAKPKPKRSYGLVIALMLLFILAGLGYGGYVWWNSKRTAPETTLVPRAQRPAIPPAVPPTASTATEAPLTTTSASIPTAAVKPAVPQPTSTRSAAPPPPVGQAPATAGASASRQRFDAMAREFASTPQSNFTVQFEIVCEPSNIEKALRTGGSNVWFVPISIKGRGCYRVFWGRYATRDEAERGSAAIPAVLREGKASVVEVPRP